MPTSTPDRWDFDLTYWGTTGSYPRPASRDTQKARLVQAFTQLHAQNRLTPFLEAVTADRQDGSLASLVDMVANNLFPPFVGNTTCIELRTKQTWILFDAGSGLVEWGRRAVPVAEDQVRPGTEGHLILSHVHLDHLCGLPFADPFYDERMSWTIWAPHDVLEQLREILSPTKSANPSLIPVSLDQLVGIRELRPLRLGTHNHIGDTRVTVHPLNHPGGAYAYGLESGSSRICLATDHEHSETGDVELATFAKSADLLYLDAQYTEAEYEGREGIDGGRACSRQGWGHSTVESSIATAVAAGVKQLHLGHHDPRRTLDSWKELNELSQRVLRDLTAASAKADLRVTFAREGERIFLPAGEKN